MPQSIHHLRSENQRLRAEAQSLRTQIITLEEKLHAANRHVDNLKQELRIKKEYDALTRNLPVTAADSQNSGSAV